MLIKETLVFNKKKTLSKTGSPDSICSRYGTVWIAIRALPAFDAQLDEARQETYVT